MSTLHIVFTPSGAQTLLEALRKVGRHEQVIVFPDNLSYGPINPPDPANRLRWIEENLQVLGRFEPESVETFWKTALVPDVSRIVWMSERIPYEYAGFLEWVCRVGNRPYEVVDLSDRWETFIDCQGNPRPKPLAMYPSDEIIQDNLWNQVQTLTESRCSNYKNMWNKLREENAPLRVVKGNELVSAPIDYFDGWLLDALKVDWRKFYFVIGQVLYDQALQTGDALLAARLRWLIDTGKVDARGDFSENRLIQVRRKTGETNA